VTKRDGGRGAVRELADLLLAAQGYGTDSAPAIDVATEAPT
jgi:3-deoxy-D-manno-octulosonate 8-phosphate phosphatase KdsC-like HAD superfamily phosphatase